MADGVAVVGRGVTGAGVVGIGVGGRVGFLVGAKVKRVGLALGLGLGAWVGK